MKRKMYLSLLLPVIFSACSIFQKDSFEGEWQLRLTGSIDESFSFIVLPDNSFTTNKIINYSGRDFDVTVKGKVGTDGKLEADIIVSGQVMGQVKGLMTYESGKGNWGANVLSGEWTSTKK
jgi:hypothetical protein